MKKIELMRMRGLPEEIKLLKEELLSMEEQEYVADVVKDGHTGYPKPTVISGLSSRRFMAEKHRLQSKILQKEALVEKFETWVESVPDADTRRLLRYIYKLGLSQKQAAKAMGAGWTRDMVAKKLERFFAENESVTQCHKKV